MFIDHFDEMPSYQPYLSQVSECEEFGQFKLQARVSELGDIMWWVQKYVLFFIFCVYNITFIRLKYIIKPTSSSVIYIDY